MPNPAGQTARCLLRRLGCVVERSGTDNSHTLSFYFSNVIGLVQRIVRFVMRTEPKASYRTVQYEYMYRYTPSRDTQNSKITYFLVMNSCERQAGANMALEVRSKALETAKKGIHIKQKIMFSSEWESLKGTSNLRDILQSVPQLSPQILNITPLALLDGLSRQMNVVYR